MLTAGEFVRRFSNTDWPSETSVFFTVRQENSPDFTMKKLIQNGDYKHAEIFVLEELQNRIPHNEEKYEVILFMTYTPCAECSEKLLTFLAENTTISMEIRASNIYHLEQSANQNGLRRLNNAGVSIRIMNQSDYKECFQLSVSPQEVFEPWETLDDYSMENAKNLALILNSLDKPSGLGHSDEMPCFLRKLLPEKDFEENFKNKTIVRKTLVLFSLRKGSSALWETWGYAYNDPGKQHAEFLVLSNIEGYIPESQITGKYKMTLFMSHTPCHECSSRITSFLESRKGLFMEIKASRPYFFKNEGRKGLCLLKRTGILIKMMDRFDFEECFHLFVHPSKMFTPWSDLDEQSKKNAHDLDALWKQTEDEKIAEKEKKTEEKAREEIKISNHGSMIDTYNISVCAASQLDVHKVSDAGMFWKSICQTPEIERTQLSGLETPQKLNYSDRTTEACQSVKRKLDFLEK